VKGGYDKRVLWGKAEMIILWRGSILEGGGISMAYSSVAYCLVGGVWFWGFLVNQKQGAPVCWGFWARGRGYPYDILELVSRTGCS